MIREMEELCFLNNSFGKNLELLQRTMDATLYRRSVISDNIANADTPNFKRSVVNFESELKSALKSEKTTGMEAAMTDPKHISFNKTKNWMDVKPRKVLDYLTQSDNNGNNVDAEEELMLAMQNQLQYNLSYDVYFEPVLSDYQGYKLVTSELHPCNSDV